MHAYLLPVALVPPVSILYINQAYIHERNDPVCFIIHLLSVLLIATYGRPRTRPQAGISILVLALGFLPI